MRERERQADRQRERGGGRGGEGPQASSNLWHGKKKELAPSLRVCAHRDQRGRREDAQQPSAVVRTLLVLSYFTVLSGQK